MIGGSYDGTTANMVAARSAQAPGLAGIVPIAAISRWYGYAYSHGVRYSGNSQRPDRRGRRHAAGLRLRLRPHAADRPDRARRGARPHPALRRRSPHAEGLRQLARLRRVLARARLPQGRGALRRPGADRPRLAGLQRQAGGGRRAVQGARRRSRSRSCSCSRTATARRPTPPSCRVLDAFFDRVLKGVDTGIEAMPAVMTQGRTAAGTTPASAPRRRGRPPARSNWRCRSAAA